MNTPSPLQDLMSLARMTKEERKADFQKGKSLLLALFVSFLIILLAYGQSAASEEITFNLEVPKTHWTLPLDLDRLWYAVSLHESGLPGNRVPCATEWHRKARNCTSIMSWATGTRKLKNYATIEDNKADFKRLWAKSYGNRLPTMKEAIRYSGNDNAKAWLVNVTNSYYKL